MGKILQSKKPSGNSEFDFFLTEIWEAIENRTRIIPREGVMGVAYTDKGVELTPASPRGGGAASTGMVHRGEWSSTVTYSAQNMVTRGTLGEFVAFGTPPVGTPPESGAPYWHGLMWPSPGVWA